MREEVTLMTKRRFVHVIALTLGVFAISLTLAGCSIPGVAQYPSVQEAQSAAQQQLAPALSTPALLTDNTLTVGIHNSASVPMLSVAEDGAVSGIDVDCACALAQELGLKVKFVIVNDTKAGLGKTCDIVMDSTSANAGDSKVVSTYAQDASAFFSKNSDGTVKVDALKGKKVGLQEGSLSQKALAATDLKMVESSYPNLNEAFKELNEGKLDYVLCDAYAGSYLAMSFPDIKLVGVLGRATGVGIAINPSNTTLLEKVQAAMSALEGDGTLEIIQSRWLGGLSALTADNEIKGVPMTQKDEAETSDASAIPADDPRDGSTAGANAISL